MDGVSMTLRRFQLDPYLMRRATVSGMVGLTQIDGEIVEVSEPPNEHGFQWVHRLDQTTGARSYRRHRVHNSELVPIDEEFRFTHDPEGHRQP